MGYFSSKLESEEGKLETESDKLAMGFNNWCTKLTIDKDENCFVVLGDRINAKIKPTGVLLKIYKKTLKKT